MTHAILVHGRNANALSWNGLEDDLGALGRTARAITLPGHRERLRLERVAALAALGRLAEARAEMDDDRSPVTMADWVDEIARHLPADGAKATLIGHSMGGAVISHAAARHPNRIERLVYVAAMLPDGGESVSVIEARIAAAGVDPVAGLAEFAAVGPELATVLVRQPTGPLAASFDRTTAFDAIPKVFLLCSADAIIPTAVQREMIRRRPGVRPIEMSSGHLPQYEARACLVKHLVDVLDGRLV